MAFGFALAQHWKWDAEILPFEALRYPEFIASTSHPCPGVWAILSKAGREFALAFAWGPTMTGSGGRRELQHGNLPIRVAPKRSVSWVRPLGTHAFPTSGHLRLARQLTKDGVAPCQYQILGRLHPGHAAQLQHPRSMRTDEQTPPGLWFTRIFIRWSQHRPREILLPDPSQCFQGSRIRCLSIRFQGASREGLVRPRQLTTHSLPLRSLANSSTFGGLGVGRLWRQAHA